MNRPDTFAAEVADTCRAHDLLRPGERVLVAVSGGADSMALALLLHEASAHALPLSLVLGHVDHGWRGAEAAARDRAAVERLARRIDAPLDVAPTPNPPVRTEDEARRWRYNRLALSADRHGCRKVATGHHLRDQAETVLMRLLRGSGPVGLAGIPRRRPLGEAEAGLEVVRPLLDVDPRRLRAFLEARGVAWVEDETNLDPRRDRARIRRRLEGLEAR
ncbi:MAG: tRNA lysidine(34) synthetase TilS, partial [Planctomycetota bacterium]